MKTQGMLWFIVLAIAACESSPNPATAGAAGPADSFEVGQSSDADAGDADAAPADTIAAANQVVKVDFLWMIDHSSSMAQEQRQLAKAFDGFAKQLASTTGGKAIDAQMAFVTVQQVADTVEIKKIGQFVHKPATSMPPSAIERIKMPCLVDADCATPKCIEMSLFDGAASMCPADGAMCLKPPATGAGDWFCKTDMATPKFNNNDNCSINTYCQFRCKYNTDCYPQFEPTVGPDGKHHVFCNNSTTNPGCAFPPDTEGCPSADKLPAVLKQSLDITDNSGNKVGTQLDWFRCAASVGASQTKEAQFEGGLRSMWTALDPKGINCPAGADGKPGLDCQYQQLVRPDAYLVLVAISDDDDCSYALDLEEAFGDTAAPAFKDALKKAIHEEVRAYCQQYGDRVAGNAAQLSGYCELMKYKDKMAGKAERTCPSDCHTKAGAARTTCQAEADKNIGDLLAQNPSELLKNSLFASVTDFADRFKSLKADPTKVLFATMTGDSLAVVGKGGRTLQQQLEVDRATYYRSLMRNMAAFQAPYICSGPRGEAGFGSRYIGVANEFGSNGFVWNICKGVTLDDGMTGMANWLRERVQGK